MNHRDRHAWMKVGIVHFMAFPACMGGAGPTLPTLTEIATDPFFGAVEVTAIADDRVRREAAALLHSAGLEVGFGAQPMLLAGGHDLGSRDADRRQAALALCDAALSQARELGAGKLAVLSGPDPGEAGRPAAREALISSLCELGQRCRDAGITLVLETFDRTIDKKCLLGPNAEAAEVAREVRRTVPDFGLMIDLSHLPLQGESSAAAVRAVADVLVHAHCGNAICKDPSHPLYGDHHPRFGHPDGENGAAELREFIAALIEAGYLQEGAGRTLAFEVKPAPGELGPAVIAQAKRTLLTAWATLAV